MNKHASLLLATCAAVLAIPTAASAAPELLTFKGKLGNGYSSSGSFGTNTSLTGQTYTVQLSYDPTQFVSSTYNGVNSCAAAANASCSFNLSTSRTVTETLTIGSVTKVYTYTSGNFGLNAGGPDNASFNLGNASGDNFSVYLQDGDSFFPNQNSVNNPIFSNFSNLTLSTGTFNQSNSSFSAGANPTMLTSNLVTAVPEPAAWAMLIAGFGLVGMALRRRSTAVRVRFA